MNSYVLPFSFCSSGCRPGESRDSKIKSMTANLDLRPACALESGKADPGTQGGGVPAAMTWDGLATHSLRQAGPGIRSCRLRCSTIRAEYRGNMICSTRSSVCVTSRPRFSCSIQETQETGNRMCACHLRQTRRSQAPYLPLLLPQPVCTIIWQTELVGCIPTLGCIKPPHHPHPMVSPSLTSYALWPAIRLPASQWFAGSCPMEGQSETGACSAHHLSLPSGWPGRQGFSIFGSWARSRGSRRQRATIRSLSCERPPDRVLTRHPGATPP